MPEAERVPLPAMSSRLWASPSASGRGWGGVQFAAFTGKAALVMTRKGTPASTIHSLIYRVSEATEEEIERVEKELAQLKAGLFLMGPGELAFARNADRPAGAAPCAYP